MLSEMLSAGSLHKRVVHGKEQPTCQNTAKTLWDDKSFRLEKSTPSLCKLFRGARGMHGSSRSLAHALLVVLAMAKGGAWGKAWH